MPTGSSGECKKRSEWNEHGTTATGGVFHFKSTVGGPNAHAGTNGANERERQKINTYRKMEPSYPDVNVPANSTTVVSRQVKINGPGVNPMQPNNVNNSYRSQRNGILSTNMTS